MTMWRGLRQWHVLVKVQVSTDTDVVVMSGLRKQLHDLLPDRDPANLLWLTLLKEVQDRHVLHARLALTAGSPGSAAEHGLECVRSACEGVEVRIVDVDQITVSTPRRTAPEHSLR